jgi:F-type H+-transporting ATPase subunit c
MLSTIIHMLPQAAAYTREYAGAWALFGAGLGAGLAVVGIGLGVGRVGGQAVEAMARQPEMAGRVNTAAIVFAALVEGAGLIAIVVAFLIQNKFPFTN